MNERCQSSHRYLEILGLVLGFFPTKLAEHTPGTFPDMFKHYPVKKGSSKDIKAVSLIQLFS